ncbi:MAG: hypothetical protein M1833_005298 [Piccolia ochrophora]|nr:MAG: hypothetical protein M1833_005298 [Piccolia ochrophora]
MSQDAQYFTPQQTVRETLMGTQAFVPTRPTGVDPQKCFSPHSVSSAYQLASPETFLRFHERNFPRKARAATSNVSSDDQQQTLPQRIAPQAVATPTNVSRKGKEKAPPEMAASQEEKLRIYPALTPTVSATARLESLLDFGLQQGLPEQAQSPQTGDLLSWEMSPLKPSKGIKEENVADTHGHGRSLSTLADEFADLSLKGKAVKDAVTRGVSMGSNVTSEGLQAETSVSGLPAASRTMAPVPTRRADRATLAAPATPTKPSVSATKPTPAPQATVAKPAAPKQPKALAGDLTKSRWAS